MEEIFNQYEIKGTKKKRLVVCHGKKHKRKFRCALTLNRANVLKPDIVSDLWSPRAINYLRPNYFDTIIMEHCPLENPFQKRNNKVWKNLYRILKKDGKIINESILGLYGINVKDKWFHDMTKEGNSSDVLRRIDHRDGRGGRRVGSRGRRNCGRGHSGGDTDTSSITRNCGGRAGSQNDGTGLGSANGVDGDLGHCAHGTGGSGGGIARCSTGTHRTRGST